MKFWGGLPSTVHPLGEKLKPAHTPKRRASALSWQAPHQPTSAPNHCVCQWKNGTTAAISNVIVQCNLRGMQLRLPQPAASCMLRACE